MAEFRRTITRSTTKRTTNVFERPVEDTITEELTVEGTGEEIVQILMNMDPEPTASTIGDIEAELGALSNDHIIRGES